MKTMPTRIDGELFAAAKAAGERQSRSAAQQLDHWARIGRELESSPSVTHAMVEAVLGGTVSYDDVPERVQAVVRVAWQDAIEADIKGLDLEAELEAAGRPWAEAGPGGEAIIRQPSPSR
jgi:ParD-like antitoxin of type II bacterial toxin-antitoxin system